MNLLSRPKTALPAVGNTGNLWQDIAAAGLILYYGLALLAKVFKYHLYKVLQAFQPVFNQVPDAWLWLYPLLEALIIAALLLKRTRKFAAIAVMVLNAIILIYRTVYYIEGKALPCVCGPYIRKMGALNHLLLNAALIAISVFIIWSIRFPVKRDRKK